MAAGGGGRLADARRLVVKVGSALLVDPAKGEVYTAWLDALCDDLARCRARGQEVLVVTSGAIALGRGKLGLPRRPTRLAEKQAAAAVGQIHLMSAWLESLARHGLGVGQVLLTLEDTEERSRYLSARSTLTTLLGRGAIPIINENDTVATEEIRFGDNDRLAARVAAMMAADTLVLLSDIDGLYTADPRVDPDAALIPEVGEITPEIEAMGGDARSAVGTGGMVTKLAAGRICLAAGCRMVIAAGKPTGPLGQIEAGRPCTWFAPAQGPRAARKAWIAGALKPLGTLEVDEGAARALQSGRSLLPAGVRRVSGEFGRGDAVLVVGPEGRVLARGLAAYSGEDARRLVGRRSDEILALLGFDEGEELIHRDDLVLEHAGRG